MNLENTTNSHSPLKSHAFLPTLLNFLQLLGFYQTSGPRKFQQRWCNNIPCKCEISAHPEGTITEKHLWKELVKLKKNNKSSVDGFISAHATIQDYYRKHMWAQLIVVHYFLLLFPNPIQWCNLHKNFTKKRTLISMSVSQPQRLVFVFALFYIFSIFDFILSLSSPS